MRCRGRASRFRARVDIGNTLPRPAPRTRGSTPPGRTGPWRRWRRQAYRRRTRALLSLERVEGIEPSSKAWEAFVLPLNYTRISIDFTTFPSASAPRQGAVAVAAGSEMQCLAVQECDVDSSIGISGFEVQLVGRMEQGRVEQDTAILPVRNAVRLRSLLLHVSVDLGPVVVVVLKTPVPGSRYVVDDHSAGFPIFACCIGSDPEIHVDLGEIGMKVGSPHPLIVLERPRLDEGVISEDARHGPPQLVRGRQQHPRTESFRQECPDVAIAVLGLPDGRLLAKPAQLQQGRAREEIIDDDQRGRVLEIRRLHGIVVGCTQRLARKKRSVRPIVKLPQCPSQGLRVVAFRIEGFPDIPGPVVVALQYRKGKRRTFSQSASLMQQLELLVIVADPRLGNRPSEKVLDPPRQ